MTLRLDRYESFFVVFREPVGGPSTTGPNFPTVTTLAEVSGPWQVQFQTGRGAPDKLMLDELCDWSKHPDPGVRFFSGVATYQGTFGVSESFRVDRGTRLYVDLGRVAVIAEVTINGRDLGVVWTAPFHVDATDALRPGTNTIEVRVANLWPNRLIGDAGLPPEQRVTWTTWNPFAQNTPLLESGLLGPVIVRVAQSAFGE